jgi:hypothetical protein
MAREGARSSADPSPPSGHLFALTSTRVDVLEPDRELDLREVAEIEACVLCGLWQDRDPPGRDRATAPELLHLIFGELLEIDRLASCGHALTAPWGMNHNLGMRDPVGRIAAMLEPDGAPMGRHPLWHR